MRSSDGCSPEACNCHSRQETSERLRLLVVHELFALLELPLLREVALELRAAPEGRLLDEILDLVEELVEASLLVLEGALDVGPLGLRALTLRLVLLATKALTDPGLVNIPFLLEARLARAQLPLELLLQHRQLGASSLCGRPRIDCHPGKSIQSIGAVGHQSGLLSHAFGRCSEGSLRACTEGEEAEPQREAQGPSLHSSTQLWRQCAADGAEWTWALMA
mmetsp:Transcript_47299/g.134595  ORF Transcript_47299/g.134595 Transcript_47299/m.134595 type:complete len:221 (-) Transcript_47299:11-673(-)